MTRQEFIKGMAAVAALSGCRSRDCGATTGGCCAKKRWYKGNLHTHTMWSDGKAFPEEAVAWYKSRGYNFLGLSDHNLFQDDTDRWTEVIGDEERYEMPKNTGALGHRYQPFVRRSYFDDYVLAFPDAALRTNAAGRTEARLRLHRRQLELSLGIADGKISFGNQTPGEVRYALLGKNDLTFYRSHPSGPAAFLLQEPESGWETLFRDAERFRAVWTALGDGETLGAAQKILSMPCNMIVAREALEAMLELEKPETSIPLLLCLNLLYFSTCTVDGRERDICFLTPDPAILVLLSMTRLFYERSRAEPEMYVTGGGWNFRPPLYRGEKPEDPRDWYLNADLL